LLKRSMDPIQRPVDFSYIWGDALQEMEHVMPDLRVINLETAVTESDDYWKGKSIKGYETFRGDLGLVYF